MKSKLKVKLKVKKKSPPNKYDQLIKELEKQGSKRERLHSKYKIEVEESYRLALKAKSAGVPVGKTANALQLSRQWIAKMGQHNGRNKSRNKT
jgi:hypothetical protein